jgi:uncharacterized protein (TIGR00725 family)
MPRKPVIGVIGSDDPAGMRNARELGRLLGEEGWVVVSGGRDSGVMREVNQGAADAGGLTIGILPHGRAEVAPGVQVAIITDMNNARNNLIGLSADVVVACGVNGAGTASEVALALKNERPVILLAASQEAVAFFKGLAATDLYVVSTPQDAVDTIKTLL